MSQSLVPAPVDRAAASPSVSAAVPAVSRPAPPSARHDLDVEVLADALAPRFHLVAGPGRRRARVCLDTFDWRLFRKSLTVELVGAGASRRLVLSGPHGTRLETPLPGRVKPPLKLAGVPSGALRDKLAEVIDVRALLPLVQVEDTVQEARVLDDQDKTVVRLAIESGSAVARRGDDPVPLAPRIRLLPVRGYDGAARAVATALVEAGIPLASSDDVRAAYVAAGLTPGKLPGTPDPLPTPDMPAPKAVASVLRAFLDEIEANVPGAIADIDVEYVHELRISVRRSRSALKLAGDALPAGTVEKFGGELKWLGDVTTPVRDLDVHLLDLPKLAARLEAFPAGDLDAFGEHLARHRVAEVRAMARALSSRRYQRFVRSWRLLLDAVVGGRSYAMSAPSSAASAASAVSVGELAALRVARADRRVVKLGERIHPESPAEELHTLRKRAKELRYVLDLFMPVLDAAEAKPLMGELKALQDVLGAFQDSEVQREALRTFAGQMLAEQATGDPVPVDTLLALGELATHLEVDQRRARAHFDQRFAAYVRPDVRRHVEALAQAPTARPARPRPAGRRTRGQREVAE